MVEFTQIGWFDRGSRRFAYTDVVDDMVKRGRGNDGYTCPVFAIDAETASRLSVHLESARHAPQQRKGKIIAFDAGVVPGRLTIEVDNISGFVLGSEVAITSPVA